MDIFVFYIILYGGIFRVKYNLLSSETQQTPTVVAATQVTNRVHYQKPPLFDLWSQIDRLEVNSRIQIENVLQYLCTGKNVMV